MLVPIRMQRASKRTTCKAAGDEVILAIALAEDRVVLSADTHLGLAASATVAVNVL